MLLLCIPYHVTDYPYYVDKTVLSFRRAYGRDLDVLVVTDEGTVMLNGAYEGRFKQGWVPGFGVGKAINYCAYYAVKMGYTHMIKADGHMLMLKNPWGLIRRNMTVPKTHAIERAPSLDVDVKLDISQQPINYSAVHLNIWLNKDNWRWAYVLSTRSHKTIMSADPMQVIPAELLETLISVQGEVTPCHYWGKELFDTTLSAFRLTKVDMDIVDSTVVAHLYKSSVKTGFQERNKQRCIREPFCEYITPGTDVWLYSIMWGDCVFALKHYDSLPPFVRKDICERVMSKEYIMEKIREFKKNAVLSLDEAYAIQAKYMEGAQVVYP